MNIKKLKVSSNTIIIVIVAFLAGILITSAFNRNDNDINDEGLMEEITGETGEMIKEEAVNEENTSAPATAATIKPKAVYSGSCAPSISGYKDSKLNAVVVSWVPCESDDFQFYKIVKSSKNPNPSYPADSVVVSSSNKNLTNHVDKTVSRATTYYYRACVVQRLGKVNCGNIVSVNY